MSEQEQRVPNGHTPESNVPEEPEDEVAVAEGQDVSEEPFEGEGFEGTQASSLQGTEAIPGYEQMRAPLDQILADPNIALTAPDTTGLRNIAEASFGELHLGMNPVADPVVEAPAIQETVQGTDDRIQITNTSVYPWRVHASLRVGPQHPGYARAQRQLAPLWVGYQHRLSLGHWVDGFWRRELRLRRDQNPHRVGQHRGLVRHRRLCGQRPAGVNGEHLRLPR